MQFTRNEITEIKYWCTRWNQAMIYVDPDLTNKLSRFSLYSIVENTAPTIDNSGEVIEIDLSSNERNILKKCVKDNADLQGLEETPAVYFKL